MVVEYSELYLTYIERKGVGYRDQVADSRKSYISYLRSVSRLLGATITPDLLRTHDDVENVARRMEGLASPATIRNYRSAMRQYSDMVRDEGL